MPLQQKRSWVNWDGLEPVGAWQPLYAPSYRDSLYNWRGGWASEGVAPPFSPVIGWSPNGSSQYLKSGVTLVDSLISTAIIRLSDPVPVIDRVFGYSTGIDEYALQPGMYGIRVYWNGPNYAVGGTAGNGVATLSGNAMYWNGVGEGTIVTGASTEIEIYIGCSNYSGTPTGFSSAKIQAFALFDCILTPAQVWQRSQMLAHLENPAWNVWAPARRWFIPPPPPAAATPVLSTIYINSADIGDTSLFDDVSGAAVSASYARTGTNSFKLDGTDYLQANLTSSATKYTKFGLLVTDTPASDALLVAWQETGTTHVSLYLTDKLTLQMRQGSTIIQTSPTTLETETWYCIETKIVVHDTIGRFQVRIDGVDDMAAIGINTDDGVSGTINEIRFESPVDDTYIDDIVVREDQWCGTGGVYVVVPTAAGTVEEWTGAYTDVDDLPPSFTDYIEGSTGGSDQLFRHGGLAGDYDINVVGVFAKGRLAATADEVFYALARSVTTDDTGDAQDLDTTGVYARVLLTADPHGNIAWTTHAVNNALQIGIEA